MRLTTLSLAATLAFGAAAAVAQTAPAGGPTDTKNIGDYLVRCFPVQSPSPCDMYEELDDKNSRQRVLGFSLAYVPSADRYAVQIAVPLGVSIPKGLQIQTASFTSPAMHYRRCDRAGCYVEMMLEKATVDQLSHATPEAKIKIVADNGKGFDLRLSLNGFPAAHDAMVELARAKAKAPPAAGQQPAPAAPAAPAATP